MPSYTLHACSADPHTSRLSVTGRESSRVMTAAGKKFLSELAGSTKSSVIMNGPVTHADVHVTARHGGASGDAIRVRFLTGGVLGVSVDGADVTVQLGSSPTAQLVADAINADESAAELISATPGGAGVGVPVGLPYTNLGGGVDDGDLFTVGTDSFCVATKDVGV